MKANWLAIILTNCALLCGATTANGAKCALTFASRPSGQSQSPQTALDFAIANLKTNKLGYLAAESSFRARGSNAYPSQVNIDPLLQRFRTEVLSLRDSNLALFESTVDAMTAELRLSAIETGIFGNNFWRTAEKNEPSSRGRQEESFRGGIQLFDFLIKGAGVHGLISALAIKRRWPQARILVVDRGDTVGANFLTLGHSGRINSLSNPSVLGQPGRPGGGNLNEIPGGPIQLPDLSPDPSPSFQHLGMAIALNWYAVWKVYGGVAFSFNSDLIPLDLLDFIRPEKLFPEAVVDRYSRFFTIGESLIATKAKIIATGDLQLIPPGLWSYRYNAPLDLDGLGSRIFDSKAPIGLGVRGRDTIPLPEERFLGAKRTESSTTGGLIEVLNSKENFTSVRYGGLPPLMNSRAFLQWSGRVENPYSYFVNRVFAVVGKGDSALTVLGLLAGVAPEAAYGSSVVQDGRPKRIILIGIDAENCLEFLNNNRINYVRIGTAFKLRTRLGGDLLIEAYPSSRLKSVTLPSLGFRNLDLGMGSTNRDLTSITILKKDGELETINGIYHVITAIGSPVSVERNSRASLFGPTRDSYGAEVELAKISTEVSDTAVREIIVGPSARLNLPAPERRSNEKNNQSIFGLGPRTYAAASLLAEGVSVGKESDRTKNNDPDESQLILDAPLIVFRDKFVSANEIVSSKQKGLAVAAPFSTRRLLQDPRHSEFFLECLLAVAKVSDLLKERDLILRSAGTYVLIEPSDGEALTKKEMNAIYRLLFTRDFFPYVLKLLSGADQKTKLRISAKNGIIAAPLASSDRKLSVEGVEAKYPRISVPYPFEGNFDLTPIEGN